MVAAPPFLPLPSADYVRFRMQTQYGDAAAVPTADDVVAYLVGAATGPARDAPLTFATGRRSVAQAGEFHAPDLLADGRPGVVVCEPTARPCVLGSAAVVGVVDVDACRRAGVDIVKRRSGGGAVLVQPGEMSWFDVVVPAGGGASSVAGMSALDALAGAHVVAALTGCRRGRRRGARRADAQAAWSATGCFAGLGPGEVVLGRAASWWASASDGTRDGARFQCIVHVRW